MMTEQAEQKARLENFPISWFATVMGLSGFSIAWHRAETVLALPFEISHIVLSVTILVFIVLGLLYLVKYVRYTPQVAAEFAHPIKLNFFPTISIGLLLISIALSHHQAIVSQWLWVVGAMLHILFTLYFLSVWIHHTHFEIQHINPAWFIPIVGNILVPIVGVKYASPEISWFFFSIGLLFWLVLMTIIFYRVIFHQALPGKLTPTLFILIAPPAVGFISWVQLTGSIDAFGRILYYAALFLTLMLATQLQRFARLQFFLSWWAYSFPMAAITIATLLMYRSTGLVFFKGLSILLLALLNLIIVMLVVKTLVAIARKQICVEET
jgi:tellurite resistance protein